MKKRDSWEKKGTQEKNQQETGKGLKYSWQADLLCSEDTMNYLSYGLILSLNHSNQPLNCASETQFIF